MRKSGRADSRRTDDNRGRCVFPAFGIGRCQKMQRTGDPLTLSTLIWKQVSQIHAQSGRPFTRNWPWLGLSPRFPILEDSIEACGKEVGKPPPKATRTTSTDDKTARRHAESCPRVYLGCERHCHTISGDR